MHGCLLPLTNDSLSHGGHHPTRQCAGQMALISVGCTCLLLLLLAPCAAVRPRLGFHSVAFFQSVHSHHPAAAILPKAPHWRSGGAVASGGPLGAGRGRGGRGEDGALERLLVDPAGHATAAVQRWSQETWKEAQHQALLLGKQLGKRVAQIEDKAAKEALRATNHLQRTTYQTTTNLQKAATEAALQTGRAVGQAAGHTGAALREQLAGGGQALHAAVEAAPLLTISVQPWDAQLTLNLAVVTFAAGVAAFVRFGLQTLSRWLQRAQTVIPGVRRLKHEERCRELMQRMFDRPFTKVRPPWLTNPTTGRALELDIYSESLKLAVEYDGQQHAKFSKFFHKDRAAFLAQKKRDQLKDDLCMQQGISLIRVPSTVKFDHLEEFLKLQLVLAGRPPPSLGKDVLRAIGHLRDSAVLAAA